ncbi:MAG TPA: ADOP family duplicated permease [Lacunisphaera sp.]|nr:ADOP family duplicated permease [Lacunisphaera sp.]
MKLFRQFLNLFRRGRLEADMAEEMRLHVEGQTERNRAAGMNPDEARYAALRQFGNVASIQERAREGRGWTACEQVLGDLGYALRNLRRTPGFTAMAGGTLALGIGLVTTQFSLVSGALYRGLPFESAERLMTIERATAQGTQRFIRLDDFRTWRDQQSSFRGLGAYRNTVIELSGSGLPAQSFRGAAFSSGVLEVLRIVPVLGRGFRTDDERSDAPGVVLLSEDLWRNEFGGAPDIIGRALRIRGETATIVGVLPTGFAFPRNESVWVNLRLPPAGGPRREDAPQAAVIGRLNEGTTLSAARAEFARLIAQTEAMEPDAAKRARISIKPTMESLNSTDIQVVMYSLLGVVGGVLLLACLNVGNLLSARALQRGQELAVRSALGASRARIVRLMISESLLLAMIGAGGGLVLSVWTVPALDRGLAVASRPFWVEFAIDYRVLAVTATLTLVIGLLAGLFPALHATRRGAGEMLKESGAGAISSARLSRLTRWLVVAQVAVSCMVLTATSVLVDGSRRRTAMVQTTGADRILSAQVRLRTPKLERQAQRAEFYRAMVERLRAVPGVKAAAITSQFPFGSNGQPLEVRDRPLAAGAPMPGGFLNAVSPGYFATTGLTVRAGREFDVRDQPGSEPVAVITESLAHQLWPGETALGRQLRPHQPDAKAAESWLTVVGIVADMPADGPDFRAGIHVPVSQHTPTDAVVVVAADVPPLTLAKPLRAVVSALDEDVPVDRVFTLAGRIEDDLKLLQTLGGLALAFGLGALLLAAVGIYGVTLFAVQRRTREFGVRLALGAQPGQVMRLVMRGGLTQCVAGIVAGGAAGWALSRPLESILANIQAPVSGLVYLTVAGAIVVVVLLALWWPARQAARSDPMSALRAE